jgi:hypothetical protein
MTDSEFQHAWAGVIAEAKDFEVLVVAKMADIKREQAVEVEARQRVEVEAVREWAHRISFADYQLALVGVGRAKAFELLGWNGLHEPSWVKELREG